jgi:hypothetical protein
MYLFLFKIIYLIPCIIKYIICCQGYMTFSLFTEYMQRYDAYRL